MSVQNIVYKERNKLHITGVFKGSKFFKLGTDLLAPEEDRIAAWTFAAAKSERNPFLASRLPATLTSSSSTNPPPSIYTAPQQDEAHMFSVAEGVPSRVIGERDKRANPLLTLISATRPSRPFTFPPPSSSVEEAAKNPAAEHSPTESETGMVQRETPINDLASVHDEPTGTFSCLGPVIKGEPGTDDLEQEHEAVDMTPFTGDEAPVLSIPRIVSHDAEQIIRHRGKTILQNLTLNGLDHLSVPFPSSVLFALPTITSLLDKAAEVPSIEKDLQRLRTQRLKEHHQAVYISPQAKATLKASDDDSFPLMDKVKDFLKSERQVFLVLGDSGSGKSTFNRQLERVLMEAYAQGGHVPLLINLPAIRNPETELISEHLKTLNFTDNDIREMKRDRHFIIICDGYDESRLSINLHTSNLLNRPGQWSAKMIVSCRSTHARRDYLDRFQPQPIDRYSPPTCHLLQEAVIVPFSNNQIRDYVKQFVRDTEVHKLFGNRPIWSVEEYMDTLAQIPNLLQLVTNPFLLTLSLRSLPDIVKDNLDPSTIKMTRLRLYDNFINQWLEINRQRLTSMKHDTATKVALEELIDGGFKEIAIDFLQDLAAAIYKEQDGQSIVKYVHRLDKETWKAKFFGPDLDISLLRESSPLTCKEHLHQFIHRSLLEYFYSHQVFRPVKPSMQELKCPRVFVECSTQTKSCHVPEQPYDYPISCEIYNQELSTFDLSPLVDSSDLAQYFDLTDLTESINALDLSTPLIILNGTMSGDAITSSDSIYGAWQTPCDIFDDPAMAAECTETPSYDAREDDESDSTPNNPLEHIGQLGYISKEEFYEDNISDDDSALLQNSANTVVSHQRRSSRRPECAISGIPASLGAWTIESLLSELNTLPEVDDQSLSALNLAEEPDILQFLVERVHEDPQYTKQLLWVVYKSGTEATVSQTI
ncbi:hypothetical protein BGX33_006654 [Mortierella sp. NVP41]|nr:hypothetical protein BGX33_006654 [Mortierella sp. NVP41]